MWYKNDVVQLQRTQTFPADARVDPWVLLTHAVEVAHSEMCLVGESDVDGMSVRLAGDQTLRANSIAELQSAIDRMGSVSIESISTSVETRNRPALIEVSVALIVGPNQITVTLTFRGDDSHEFLGLMDSVRTRLLSEIRIQESLLEPLEDTQSRLDGTDSSYTEPGKPERPHPVERVVKRPDYITSHARGFDSVHLEAMSADLSTLGPVDIESVEIRNVRTISELMQIRPPISTFTMHSSGVNIHFERRQVWVADYKKSNESHLVLLSIGEIFEIAARSRFDRLYYITRFLFAFCWGIMSGISIDGIGQPKHKTEGWQSVAVFSAFSIYIMSVIALVILTPGGSFRKVRLPYSDRSASFLRRNRDGFIIGFIMLLLGFLTAFIPR